MRWRFSKRSRGNGDTDAGQVEAREPEAPVESSEAARNGASEDDPPRAATAMIDNGLASSIQAELRDADDVLIELRARLAAIDATVEVEPAFVESPAGNGEPRINASGLGGYVRPVPDAWLFREHVLVSAGPFVDLLDVQVLAQALTGLPAKPESSVWGFDGNKAVIRLTAEEPLRLVDEDIRSLPFRPRVVLATPSALTLELELPPVQRPRAEEGPALPLHLSA